jgi:hypothetical protein
MKPKLILISALLIGFFMEPAHHLFAKILPDDCWGTGADRLWAKDAFLPLETCPTKCKRWDPFGPIERPHAKCESKGKESRGIEPSGKEPKSKK